MVELTKTHNPPGEDLVLPLYVTGQTPQVLECTIARRTVQPTPKAVNGGVLQMSSNGVLAIENTIACTAMELLCMNIEIVLGGVSIGLEVLIASFAIEMTGSSPVVSISVLGLEVSAASGFTAPKWMILFVVLSIFFMSREVKHAHIAVTMKRSPLVLIQRTVASELLLTGVAGRHVFEVRMGSCSFFTTEKPFAPVASTVPFLVAMLNEQCPTSQHYSAGGTFVRVLHQVMFSQRRLVVE